MPVFFLANDEMTRAMVVYEGVSDVSDKLGVEIIVAFYTRYPIVARA